MRFKACLHYVRNIKKSMSISQCLIKPKAKKSIKPSGNFCWNHIVQTGPHTSNWSRDTFQWTWKKERKDKGKQAKGHTGKWSLINNPKVVICRRFPPHFSKLTAKRNLEPCWFWHKYTTYYQQFSMAGRSFLANTISCYRAQCTLILCKYTHFGYKYNILV